jgi:hypothetical protein
VPIEKKIILANYSNNNLEHKFAIKNSSRRADKSRRADTNCDEISPTELHQSGGRSIVAVVFLSKLQSSIQVGTTRPDIY